MPPYVERIGHLIEDLEQHRRFRQSIPAFVREASLLNLLTAPVVYSLLLPIAVLDVWVTLYQWTCFPIYGVARVRRRKYFAIDRRKLAYLNGIEKMNCTFCSYANGLFAYAREVAARTEQYWCPIKHAHPVPAPHGRYQRFLDYGDGRGYRARQPYRTRVIVVGAGGGDDRQMTPEGMRYLGSAFGGAPIPASVFEYEGEQCVVAYQPLAVFAVGPVERSRARVSRNASPASSRTSVKPDCHAAVCDTATADSSSRPATTRRPRCAPRAAVITVY